MRYQAANTLACLLEELGEQQRATFYRDRAQRIRESVLETFFDGATGWFYSATGIGHQYDVWATAFAVFLGITRNEKTLKALYDGYRNGTAVVDGYVRHILTDHDFSSSSAWESSLTPLNEYQNGAYWATPTGWYAYALYEYGGQTDILSDFLRHTQRYVDLGAPYEWIDARTEKVSGLNYGTSGVLPYIGAKKIAKKLF